MGGWTVGRRTAWMAAVVLMRAVAPRLGAGRSRRLFAPDDTPTKRYGPRAWRGPASTTTRRRGRPGTRSSTATSG